MTLTSRELWALIHGLVLGSVFLLAFGGALADLWGLDSKTSTPDGHARRLRRLRLGTWTMTIIVWLTNLTGTHLVYHWYRAAPPEGADLSDFPRSFLLANPELSQWHTFGMEWKEHVAWLASFLMPAIAFVVSRHGNALAADRTLRRRIIALLVITFLIAAVAGVFGALITKAAPII